MYVCVYVYLFILWWLNWFYLYGYLWVYPLLTSCFSEVTLFTDSYKQTFFLIFRNFYISATNLNLVRQVGFTSSLV